MDKIGGNRNYGYGKQLAWAGKNALFDHFGHEHHSACKSHQHRWNQFARYAKQQGVLDARKINQTLLNHYGQTIKDRVNRQDNPMKITYAQNLLSTVNVVLQTMRKDKRLSIKPAQWVGKRCHIRSTLPATLNADVLNSPIALLQQKGQERTATIVLLTRCFGLRFREASLLNTKMATKQARRFGKINITQGTKGGRGKGVDRWVPVPKQDIEILKKAAALQGKSSNLIPVDKNFRQWKDQTTNQWRAVTKDTAIKGFHDMRAAYACERYRTITGYEAPVIAGKRLANKTVDQQARQLIAQELGHGRTDVVSAYIGSSK